MMGGSDSENFFILLIADSKLPSNSGVSFFVVDPSDEKSGNVCGLIAHYIQLVEI